MCAPFAAARRVFAFVLAAGALAVALPGTANAQTTFNITSNSMAMVTDGTCTLAELLAFLSGASVTDCPLTGGLPVIVNLPPGQTFTFDSALDPNGVGVAVIVAGFDLTINGNGSTFTSSASTPSVPLFVVGGGTSLTVHNLTISGFTVSNGPIVEVVSGSVLNLEDVVLSGNTVAAGPTTHITAAAAATVNVHRSTFVDQSVGVFGNSIGNVANSTFTGSAAGAGMRADLNSTLNISSVTIAVPGGSVGSLSGSSVSIQNSLFIPGSGCASQGGTITVTGTTAQPGLCPGSLPVSAVPDLLALQNYGGITPTRILVGPVPQQDSIVGCSYLSTGTNPLFTNGATITADQRGFVRGATCDPGALDSISVAIPFNAMTLGVPFSYAFTPVNGTGPYTFSVASGSTLPPGLALSSGGTLSGTPTQAGLYEFNMLVTDSLGFASAFGYASSTIGSLLVLPGSQFIITNPLIDRTFGDPPVTLNDSASSGLAVSYASLTPAVCTVSGATITLVGVGTCTIRASQPGDANYGPAADVDASFNVAAALPGAPVIGTGTPGNALATIAFTAPSSDGGSPITGYTASCTPGLFSASAGAAVAPIAVGGLANGTAYLCSVRATNIVGTGPASATVSVTPAFTGFSASSATGTGAINVSFTGGGGACSFSSPQFIGPPPGAPPIPPTAPGPNVVFPHGLFDFSVTGCTPASTLTFTITYPTALPTGTKYWKYGPTAANTSPHWYVLPSTISGNTVTFSITDGGLGDDDLTANGTIDDQGGPGVGGDSIPTLGEWMLALLALLMLGCTAWSIPRRR